ncbi:potassium-transporting ATPase subunit KdpC [Beduini massiliensis]|uniref:potassium-transporting ATPase subunit KdpC n=1 Tax=Beduini massiliensis TaxID=1585974 RepID=UPI00059A8ABC|nr:potassium-transporting ATPase subunit KdpC [Beduini massiliensis]
MKTILPIFRKMIVFALLLTILCGGLYTLSVTGIAQVLFPHTANGSIIEIDGKKYGSALLAQQFTEDKYLWGRIMNVDTATFTDESGQPLSYGTPSNLAVTSEEYEQLISERVQKILAAHPDQAGKPIPVDLVTCSGSGLDPEISVAAAKYQIERIANQRHITSQEVEAIIDRYTTSRFLGIFGEPVVNVLKVNLALDGILK